MAPPSQLPQVQRVLQQRRRSKGGNRLNAISGKRLTVQISFRCAVMVHRPPELVCICELLQQTACSSGHTSWTAPSDLYICCGGAGLLQQSREALDQLVQSLKLEAAADAAFREQQKGVAKGHGSSDWASAGEFEVQADASAQVAVPGLFQAPAPRNGIWSRADVWTYKWANAVLLCLKVASTHPEAHDTVTGCTDCCLACLPAAGVEPAMQRSSDTARLVAEMWACLLWLLINHGAAVMAALSAGWAEQQAVEYSNWVRPASVLQTAVSDRHTDRHTAKVGLHSTCSGCMPTQQTESALVQSSCSVPSHHAYNTIDEALMEFAVLLLHCTLLGPSWGCTLAPSRCPMAHCRSLHARDSTAEPQRVPSLTLERRLVLPCRQLIWAQWGGIAQPATPGATA